MTSTHRRLTTAAILAAVLAVTGCGGNDSASTAVTPAATAVDDVSTTDRAGPTPGASTTDTTPSSEPSPSVASAAADWDPAVTERCGHIWERIVSTTWTESAAAIGSWASDWQAHLDAAPVVDEAGFPVPAVGDVGGYDATIAAAEDALAVAIQAGAADDLDGALLAAERFDDALLQSQLMLAVAGAPCFNEPARITGATLNVPLLGAVQVGAGFESVWVAKEFSGAVARVDPASGRVLATIDVGSTPFKLQPADGRMWVRTNDAYVAIDPATNTVATTLAKADVGPEANRSWAVDGALWICDGSRLHRYDPITVSLVTTLDLGIDCGQVYATSDLAVAWTYNEDDGESGASAATFIDPATNTAVATVDLPVDVGVPVVADDTVFFPGFKSAGAATVDRDTWTATEHTFDVALGGSQPATDGTFIYVPTADATDVVVIDPRSNQIVDTIEPMETRSVVVTAGGLWVVNSVFNYLQRFDLVT